VVLPLLVIGPGKLRALTPGGWENATDGVIRYGFWPVLVGLLLLALAGLYHYGTPIKLRWRRAWPGAYVGVSVVILGAYGLRLYIAHIVSRTATYGVLAAPIAALLFFYILGLAVLLGAEFNATLERMWPRGTRLSRFGWVHTKLRGLPGALGLHRRERPAGPAHRTVRAGRPDRTIPQLAQSPS